MINVIIAAGASALVVFFVVRKIIRYKRNTEAVKRGEAPLSSCCSGCSSCSSSSCSFKQ